MFVLFLFFVISLSLGGEIHFNEPYIYQISQYCTAVFKIFVVRASETPKSCQTTRNLMQLSDGQPKHTPVVVTQCFFFLRHPTLTSMSSSSSSSSMTSSSPSRMSSILSRFSCESCPATATSAAKNQMKKVDM